MKRTIILFQVCLLLFCCLFGCKENQEVRKINEILSKELHETYGQGKNVRVAVIDSGTYHHIENNNYALNFSNEETIYDGIDHGAPIINIISSKEYGLAPEATVYSLKVINEYYNASTESILSALKWCKDNSIDIINMSLSFGLFNENIECMISELLNSGVIVVSSISNQSKIVDFPSMYDGVICVGKTENPDLYKENRRIIFSDVYIVKSVGVDGMVNDYTGNSFLAPIVTGMIACIIEKTSIERRIADETLILTLKSILLQCGININ